MQEEGFIPPTTIINEVGQSVRVYDWADYQRRMRLRNPLSKNADLDGKTLVIKHTWGIGDVLYSTAALKGLKQKFPMCKIVYISGYPDILENNPDVDVNMHHMDAPSYVELAERMKDVWYWLDYDVPIKGGFDYKVNLRTKPVLNEFMTAMLKRNPTELNDDERAFIDQASSSVISRYRMVALDMYCWHAFVDPPDKSVYYYPYPYELEMAKRFFAPIRQAGKKVITLVPHSSTFYKDYPHWKEVIKLCPPNYFWVILDSFVRNDETWAGPNIFNASAAFKLRQAIAIIIESDLNCSSDTGMLYPKAARGGLCVVTYGPHEPEPFLHYFPSTHGLRVPNVIGLLPNNEPCCSVGCYIDTTSCHKAGDHPPCLWQLSPDRVASKITELLESN